MSTYEDEIYNDYLARRDRASSGRSLKRPASEEKKRNRDVGSALPSGRFIPLTQQRQSSATLSEEKRRQLKGDGSYDMPDNIYKPSGYATRPSDLGEDPLSAVRTLKNQIRREAIMSRDNGLTVRAHLCDKAKDRLSAAEGVLITMGHDRIAAVIAGDTKKAQMIAASMEKLKDDVIRDSYADLVMDKQKVDNKLAYIAFAQEPHAINDLPSLKCVY
ncbi:hypothetical protein COOONC_03324 [Cooperia oncophora]